MRTIRLMGVSAVLTAAMGGCSSSSSPVTAHDAATPHEDAGSDSAVTQPADAATGDATTVTTHDATSGADAPHAVDAHEDASHTTLTDAHEKDVSVEDASKHDAAEHDSSSADAAPAGPQHVLVTFGGAMTSEMVAVNVATKAVDGRIGFAGFGVTDSRNMTSPFLLQQNYDIVTRLDSVKPWKTDSTWSVAMTDAFDGGSLYSDPVQAVVEAASKAYVIRYDRNDIAVINESSNVDGGAPVSSINLSQFLQAGSDGLVEMTAAAYVAATNRLYVVLANINQTTAATYGGVICSTEVSTVVAINTLTDTIVSLGGSGPGGSIPLVNYDPVNVVYDAAGNRLIIVSGGCYAKPTGTTLGSPTLRGIEALDLATGKSASLLELTPTSFPAGFVDMPTSFAYIDSTHAVIGFDSTGQAVYNWNPTTTSLGALIPNAPDVFTYDGDGHLLGTRATTSDAGVVLSTAVVSVAIPGGASTTLATNVTSLTGDTYVSSVDVWPHP